MIKLSHTAFISALLLSACSGAPDKSVDLSTVPTLDITATHAIAIDQSANGLSFVPNNVAPWLGRIILQNADNSLSSTEIEGRLFQKISGSNHQETFGLARENASGVFLSISSENNRLDAFIESDDQGNFKPLSTSGEALTPKVICTTDTAQQDLMHLLDTDNRIVSLAFSIADAETAKTTPIELATSSILPAPKNTTLCTASRNHTIAYSRSSEKSHLHIDNDGKWINVAAPANITAMAPTELNGVSYLLLLDSNDIYVFNVGAQEIAHRLDIKSGLSIGGLEKTKFIEVTTHNFGGSAFSEGLVAFGQADADRIVFVSLSYLADVLKDTKS